MFVVRAPTAIARTRPWQECQLMCVAVCSAPGSVRAELLQAGVGDRGHNGGRQPAGAVL